MPRGSISKPTWIILATGLLLLAYIAPGAQACRGRLHSTHARPTQVTKSHCRSHSDCAAKQYCRQDKAGPVCSDCVDYRNLRCQDWQDSIDSQCTVCHNEIDSQPRHHIPWEQQVQQNSEQKQKPDHLDGRENQEQGHYQSNDRKERSHQKRTSYSSTLFQTCFTTALLVFGTQCFVWLLCFLTTVIVWAMDSLIANCCSSRQTSAAPTTDSKTQQKQHEPAQKTQDICGNGNSAPAVLQTETPAAMEPLVQEVVTRDDHGEQGAIFNSGVTPSHVQCTAATRELEPEPEPQPQPHLQPDGQSKLKQDKDVQPATTTNQYEVERDESSVATGFVEVIYHDEDNE